MPKSSFQIPTHKEDGIEKGNLADKEDSVAISSSTSGQDDEDDVLLPGFPFHPTDEELVGFYLRRKVNKKPISIELIKQVDIYKFDPWDLPKPRSVGDKEVYFFCRRRRKYRNSIRPNRVTESGFWKATGIDNPVYSVEGERIGLKKTLVYYRRSAGKGTNSNWMMNEFRLLMNNDNSNYNASSADEEAEVWTLYRVFKRNGRCRMTSTPEWRELPNTLEPLDTSSIDTHPTVVDSNSRDTDLQQCDKNQVEPWALTSSSQPSSSSMGSSDTLLSPYWNELFTTNGDWDELRSVVDFSFNRSNLL